MGNSLPPEKKHKAVDRSGRAYHPQQITWRTKALLKEYVLWSLSIIVMLLLSLVAGAMGFHWVEKLPWLNSFENAVLYFAGMHPIDEAAQRAEWGIFPKSYALISRLVALAMIGMMGLMFLRVDRISRFEGGKAALVKSGVDVFLSHSSKDRLIAEKLANALHKRRFSVWWDRDIPPGAPFDDVIEDALASAKCVVVLWSVKSASSNWVRIEAGVGETRKILVPAVIEEFEIPSEFSRIQAVKLVNWDPPAQHPGFDELVNSIHTYVRSPASQDDPVPKGL